MLFNYINKNDYIGIIAHRNPDIDSISSILIVERILKNMEINSKIYLEKDLPKNLEFLNVFNSKFEKKLDNHNKYICLDCANYERLSVQPKIENIINIDHHNTNTNYGDINLIDKTSVSTTHLLYKILKDQNQSLNKTISELILYGIYSDTQNLKTKNITSDTLRDVSNLIKNGINPNNIYRKINKISTKDLRTLGSALMNLKQENKYAISRIHGSLDKHLRISSNYISQLQNTDLSILITENKEGELRTSLRSNKINVSKIAEKFKGGGHKNASGFEYKKRPL